MDIYKFEPIYKERVWGGSAFKDFLKRPISSGEKIGESWDLVDRAYDQSLVLQGIEKGQSLENWFRENLLHLWDRDGTPKTHFLSW